VASIILHINYGFEASTGIPFKSAKKFTGLDSLLMPMFHEHCNLLHQGEKQPDTVSYFSSW